MDERNDISFNAEVATSHLRAVDPILGELIDHVGPWRLVPQAQGFAALSEAIVGQQISVKAADAILLRLIRHVGQLTPVVLLGHSVESLRLAGLSGQKARYILDLAQRVNDGSLDVDALAGHADEAIVAELTKVKGIGRWTAEMYLIFALLRPDILPVGDLGLRQAVKRRYSLDALPAPAMLESIAAPWRPYRSVATWYLWRGQSYPDGMMSRRDE